MTLRAVTAPLDPALADVAHVLRRTTFGPFPGQTERALTRHGSARGVIEAQLAAPPLPFRPYVNDPALPRGGAVEIDGIDGEDLRYYMGFRDWWVQRMRSDDAALHEKMMWFWHSHFTTSATKVDTTNLCWRQIRTLHQHALGNFAELTKAMSVDGAMLRYLDGSGSVASAPNENYARELMELFTLGFDKFRQADVVAAAKVLSGWFVYPDQRVEFQPEHANTTPVTVLGRTGVNSIDDLIAAILAQDTCATFVVGRLWRFLIGGDVDPAAVGRFAAAFRSSGYEIAPLVAAMLHSDEFMAHRQSRARTPIEWHAATVRGVGLPLTDATGLQQLGQTPYMPPSVAGWPGDATWLSPTQLLAKSRFISGIEFPAADELGRATDIVAAIVDRFALHGISDASRSSLRDLDQRLRHTTVDDRGRAKRVMALALLTPEFSLA